MLICCSAASFSKRQDHQKIGLVFKEGLSYCPHNARLYYALADEYRLLAQIDDAVKAYKKAIAVSNDDYAEVAEGAEAYRDLGDIYFYELKDGKEAKKYYQTYEERRQGRKGRPVCCQHEKLTDKKNECSNFRGRRGELSFASAFF